MPQLSRRNALKLIGAAAAVPALAGCSTSDAGAGSSRQAPWPTYRKAGGPTPDLPSTLADAGVDAFYTYPTQLVQSVDTPPGDGSTINSLIVTYSPPPNPPESNKLWSALNKALNADVRLNLVPTSECPQKLATITASGDLPDTMLMMNSETMPRARQFIKAKCADLTDYLSGDNILEYPNLAAIPTYAWQAMGRVDGGIYGIPLPRVQYGGAWHVNRDLLDEVGAPEPWSAEQFTQTLRDVTGGSRYGLGFFAGWNYSLEVFAGPLGAPNLWQVADGVFSPTQQSSQYRSAIEMARELNAAGLFHPGSNVASQNDMMNQYYAQKVAAVTGNFMNYAKGIYFDRVGDGFTTDVAPPFGTEMRSWLGSGIFGYTVFKDADPERIKMLLRVCDYLAAPYGTVEWELRFYGVEGVHFTRTPDGLEMLPLADIENDNTVPFHYISNPQETIHVPDRPQATKRAFEMYEKVVPQGVGNPAQGLASETLDRAGSNLYRKLADASNAIISGRAPLSRWDKEVQTFMSSGGKKIADELSRSYADSQGS